MIVDKSRVMASLCCHYGVVHDGLLILFGFGWQDVANGLRQEPAIEPVAPLQCYELDGFERSPKRPLVDHSNFAKAIDHIICARSILVRDLAKFRLI